MSRSTEKKKSTAPAMPAGERFVGYGLVALLALAPLWYGSVFEWSWGLNAVWAGLLTAALLLARQRAPADGSAPSGLPIAPVGVFVVAAAWIAIQAVGWTPALLHHPLWDLASEAMGVPLTASVSLAPEQGWLGLLRLMTIGLVLWLAFQLAARADFASTLVRAVAAVTCFYSCYGLAELAFGGGRVLFAPKNPYTLASYGNYVSATFINGNHYAAFAGMGVIAAVAMLFEAMVRDSGQRLRSKRKRIAALAARFVTDGGPAIALAVPSLLGIVLSASRAGVGCVFAGVAVVAAVATVRAARTQDGQKPASFLARYGVTFALGVLFLVSLVVVIDQAGSMLIRRAGTLDAAVDDRLSMSRLNLKGVFQNPWLGYGYGGFQQFFPLFRDMTVGYAGVWNAAHNTYFETVLGLGLPVGLALIAAVVWLVALCARGALTRRRHALAPTVAMAVAVQAGLHSLVEFPLQNQSNALLFATLLGAGVAQARSSRAGIRASPSSADPARRPV